MKSTYGITILLLAVALFSAPCTVGATPLASIPNLDSVTFNEATGGVTAYTFLKNSPQLNNRIPGSLSNSSMDFKGASIEWYDVFYSNANGTFNALGEYITVEAEFAQPSGGGGLNMAEIVLNFAGGATQNASVLTHFLGLGSNYVPGSELNVIDGNLATSTIMGNTHNPGAIPERLSITVGFPASVPEPSVLLLLGAGLVGLTIFSQKRRVTE
jgi:hypothetical protein